ncbi:MAG TPA: hypothetical protein VE422_46125 [Terriglobia bacterium]|nr:hypothetical protein [Terriglobia bacterium]
MTQATYQDADLVLKLYDMRREERLRIARAWFIGNFSAGSVAEAMEKYPPGSDHNAYYRMVSTYWDMAASFVVRGILHEELFFENNMEMLVVWEKMKDLIADLRRLRKNPAMYRNLEKGAAKHIEWLNKQAPEAHEGLRAMLAPKK